VWAFVLERRHEARLTQHVETGDECDPEKRRIIGPGADRAGVSVRRRSVESAAGDAADHERQQQGSLSSVT